ncbi:lectin c-type domain-containing protein [Phthorimaea operculella]|nr:lectin c-type domain-containing protein [Phthorimaea operculella]
MKSCLLFFILVFKIVYIDGRYYRADYTFNETLQGWTKFNRIPEKWEQARLRCFLEGSTLATPMSHYHKSIMMDTMDKYSAKLIFLGMSAIYSNGDFYSVEGNPLKEISNTWALGEPNNSGDEQCIAMYANGDLADVSCNEPLPYICYRKEPQITPSVGQCGTIDPDYTFVPQTRHCYKVHRFGQTWSKAFMTCSAEGGYLAIINSEEEQNALRDLMAKYPAGQIMAKHKDYFGVGFHDWSEHGVFMTVHGQTLKEAGFEKWAGGQPDNFPPGEFCGSVFRNAMLNDIWCTDTIPFICEMVPWSLLENNRQSCEENIPIDIRSEQGTIRP